MIIPESSNKANELYELIDVPAFQKLRNDTTDKLIAILFYAEWDASSMQLKEMVSEMPKAYSQVKFATVDCDAASDLVDHFSQVDSVPSLLLAHPHKTQFEVVAAPTPEQLSQNIDGQNTFYTQLFEQEKLKAFREIEALIQANPVQMFIKGTLDAPKCKFTRRLVESIKKYEYRNI